MQPACDTRVWPTGLSRVLAVASLTIGVFGAQVVPAAAAPALPADIRASCGASLQSHVDAAPAGSTVHVPMCVFRETVRIDKPLTLVGQPGAEIRGSDVWEGWQSVNHLWVSGNTIPPLAADTNHDGRCAESTNRCLLPEQVFMDGTPLTRVAASPQPGGNQFALDALRHVVLADDPNGRTLEVTTRTVWITSQSDGITIQGLTMRHAANDALTGAISNDGHSDWIVQDSALSNAHGAVVSVHNGNNLQVLRNDIARGGAMGIHGTQVTNGVVRGNHIHENNTDQFSPVWGAGGIKVTEVRGFLMDGNEVDNNPAVGMWCDITCTDVTFSNNRVHDNAWQGILFEISDKASIHDNVVWQNGWGAPTWGWGAGIVISSSANAEVYNNTLAWNKAGITVVDLNRPDRVKPINDYVHDNVIIRNTVSGDAWSDLSLAWLTDGSGALYDVSANNRGANNRYWYDQPESTSIRSSWSDPFHTLSDLEASPADHGGSYLNDDEKYQLLSAVGVPGAAPA